MVVGAGEGRLQEVARLHVQGLGGGDDDDAVHLRGLGTAAGDDVIVVDLVYQDDPAGSGDPFRNRPTYRVFLRLAAPMNEAEDRRYTDLVVGADTGDFLARLGG